MPKLHLTLFVLLAFRLMLPPGICVCQWNSTAALVRLGLLAADDSQPQPPADDKDDDHDPGCPASKLATGMGLRPAAAPPPPPAPSLDAWPTDAASFESRTPLHIDQTAPGPILATSLVVMLRALRI